MGRKKRFLAVIVVITAFLLTACGKKEQVSLTLWGSAAFQDVLTEMAESFKQEYAKEADITITLGIEDEDTLKDTVISNPAAAADVFIFPNDQLHDLVVANTLLPINENKEETIAANGGANSAAVKSATYNDMLYAYPMTASNGYFMYYDSSYFTSEDVKSLDRMLEVAAQNDKLLSMEWSSGWYLYSFFAGAGLDMHFNELTGTNVCNWNDSNLKYTGVDVEEALIRIASSDGFVNLDNDKFLEGIRNGTVIAGINGTWNANAVKEALGDHYAAAKLPTYTLCGNQVQMMSFAGFKLVGVNANSSNEEWAMKLGEWITNYDNQILLFEKVGEGPSNVEAAASPQILSSPAIVALSEQSKYASVQNVGDPYWKPMVVLGAIMASGNPDEKDLEELMEETVQDITAPQK